MPDALRAALAELRRTTSFEGRRRQLQFVGKLMRSADEVELREALAVATLGSARQTLALHELERWRAELIADDSAFDRWLALHPDTDAQQLAAVARRTRDAAACPRARQPRAFALCSPFEAAVDRDGMAFDTIPHGGPVIDGRRAGLRRQGIPALRDWLRARCATRSTARTADCRR